LIDDCFESLDAAAYINERAPLAAKVTATDVVILHYAGHGKTAGANTTFSN
jgi:hypothetical protein